MSATGKDTNASSTPSFIAALVTGLVVVGALTAVWLTFHSNKKFHRVYQPRADLAPEKKRPEEIPSGPLPFWKTVFSTPDSAIIFANGPDAYFFVRYIKVFGLYMLVPYFLLTFIILIPVSAVAPNAGLTGLNTMTFGNVAADHQDRHIAHFLVAIILMFWTLFLIWREYHHFITIRQGWLSSPTHLSLARTRTVAVTNLPNDTTSETAIKELAGTVSRLTGSSHPRASMATAEGNGNGYNNDGSDGGVRSVWLTRKAKDLEKIFDEREDECSRLEGGVGKLIALGNKNERKGKTPEQKGKLDTERGGADMVDRFVNPKKRPTWKQGPLGLFGRKMTLETSPIYIKEHNDQLSSLREKEDSYELGNTAFVRFSSQQEAHAFARLASSTDKRFKKLRSGIELVPEDIEWSNIKMNPYQRYIRTIISWSLTIGLIIIWAIPVAFVGIVSNVDTLCIQAPFLAWICTLPSAVLGIIKGILPPVLLAVLFMLLPIVLRLMVKQQGEIRKSDIELKLFTRFWLFQVIHGFLIVTISSGLVAALGNLGNTASSVPTLLATQLPSASIFFLTFILSTSFSSAAKIYSRVVPIVMFMLKGILAGNTPRKAYMKEYKMEALTFSTTWPPICLIVCITIVYSIIQPIIVLVALVAFALLFAAYKYTLGWCADQPDSLETGGLYYIKALRTVFVSLYLEGVCLAGLLFLSTDQNGDRSKSGLACGAIMIVMIVLIACFQIYIDHFRFKKDYLLFAQSSMSHPNASTSKLNAPTAPVDAEAEDELAENAGAERGNTTGFHQRAFDHPCFWKKQPVIWVSDDSCGIGKSEVARINAVGVEASTEFAVLDNKGHVVVERGPPDEAWYGGFSAH